MLRLSRYTSSVCLTLTLALASCSQLLGLDSLEPDEEGGEGGDGGVIITTGGRGGSGGSGGTTSDGGDGGDPSTLKGGTDGTGGSGGSGGTGGSGGGKNTDGGSAGLGGTGGGGTGGGGTGGTGGTFVLPTDCTEITGVVFDVAGTEPGFSAGFVYVLEPNVGTGTVDNLSVEFYDDGGTLNGADIGTFDIEDADSQYASCSRCVRLKIDATNYNYMGMAGTVTVNSGSDQMNGHPSVTLTDVILVESTILTSFPYTSTPVVDGDCYQLTTLTVDQPPASWWCPESATGGISYYSDNDCDCGCGVVDIDCASPTATCDFEWCSPPDMVDPQDNSQCN